MGVPQGLYFSRPPYDVAALEAEWVDPAKG